MQKTQLILIVVAIAIIGGLYSLPRVVVSNPASQNNAAKSAQNEGKMDNKADANAQEHTHADGSKHTGSHSEEENTSTHQKGLSESQKNRLDMLRKAYLQQVGDKKVIALDSLNAFFRTVNLIDSVGFYLLADARSNKNAPEKLKKAADAYFDAFGFALDSSRAKSLGQEAEKIYTEILTQNPKNLDAKAKLGVIYVSSNATAPMKGINLLLSVVEEDPNNEFALYNLGFFSMMRGAHDKAIVRFEKLLETHPRNIQAWMHLAESYETLGKNKKAYEALEKVKQLDNSPEVQKEVNKKLQELKK
jgi:hypothetical protein